MHLLFGDITGGEIVAFLTALFTFLNLVFSGRAFQVGRKVQRGLERLAKGIGHPDPTKASASDGRTLTEKVESLTDAYREFVNKDLQRRAQIAAPGTGRRRGYDNPSDDERGTGTQEDLG